MREVTLEELKQKAASALDNLKTLSEAPDGLPRIYLHW